MFNIVLIPKAAQVRASVKDRQAKEKNIKPLVAYQEHEIVKFIILNSLLASPLIIDSFLIIYQNFTKLE